VRPHWSSEISENVGPKMQPLELVAISLGAARNSKLDEPGVEEWLLNKRPKEDRSYEFYNVLWTSTGGGFSSRRGIGRIPRATGTPGTSQGGSNTWVSYKTSFIKGCPFHDSVLVVRSITSSDCDLPFDVLGLVSDHRQ
jgi:hypothetical protein